MKKNVITLIICLLVLGIFIAIPLIMLNINRNIKLKDNKGNTVIELGKYRVTKYSERKDPVWNCDFAIDDKDKFLSFIKTSTYYEESLCFDCTTEYDIVDIDTHETQKNPIPRTVGYMIKDDYLFCYDIHDNYVTLELVLNPKFEYLSSDLKVIKEEPYFVCDKHMYYYGEGENEGLVTAPCWRCGLSFDVIKNIYGRLTNITVEINESEKYVIVKTINPKDYKIDDSKKVKITFDEKSFLKIDVIE